MNSSLLCIWITSFLVYEQLICWYICEERNFFYMTNSLPCLYISQLLVWIIAHFLACATPYLNNSFPCMCFITIHEIFCKQEKIRPWGEKTTLLLQVSFGRSNFISCERVATDTWNSHFYIIFSDRTSAVRAKRLPRRMLNRNLTSVFADRTSFRAKGMRPTLETRNFTSVFVTIEPHFVRKGCHRGS